MMLFAGLALLLNAQYTWWIVYSLRENRAVLDLERAVVAADVERAALLVEARLHLEARHLALLPPGVIPAAGDPFSELQVVEGRSDAGWVVDGARLAFSVPLGRSRSAFAWLDTSAPRRWLAEVEPDFLLVERDSVSEDLPRVALAAPLDRWAVQAERRAWHELLAKYRRRVVMVAIEGAFFLAAMAAAVVLLWTVFRKETALELQHQNFVSAVTHELKTPMAGIRLALETVLSERVDEAGRQRFLTNALADVDRLAGLVGKVLEVTRYAQGAHRLRVELGDLSELVEEEVATAARRMAPVGGRIETAITPGIQAPIDPEALAIVLSNLLENALKYGGAVAAPVLVRLFVQRGQAVVEVSDRGRGVAAPDLQRLFEPFFRSADHEVRRTPGTGIGLYVAREIVKAHGGRLTAESPGRGKGATFRMVLPGASRLSEEDDSE